MHQDYTIESVLVADCGSTTTEVVLIDTVAGEHRFLAKAEAPTTVEPPFSDITSGILKALETVRKLTGREFIVDGKLVMPQTATGDGVDLFLLTSSAGRPLIVAVANTTRQGAEAVARAVRSTYSSICSVIQLDEAAKMNSADWAEGEVDKLIKLQPDVLVVAGDEDGDPLDRISELLRVVAAGLPEATEQDSRKCQVIFAGNEKARATAVDFMEGRSDLYVLGNVRAGKGEENVHPVRNQLRSFYRGRILAELPGVDMLGISQDSMLSSTAEAVELATRFLSKEYQRDVLTVDLGGTSTSLCLASGDQCVSWLQPNLGLSYGMPNLLSTAGADNIIRWLDFDSSEEEISNWAFNKLLRPFSIPMSPRELAIEQAFAREALYGAFRSLVDGIAVFPLDLIVGSGGVLTHAADPAQAALIMLDAIQPTGETTGSVELALDSTDLLAPVGAMSAFHPDGAAVVFNKDALLWLGTVITPLGTGEPGETAVKVSLESDEGEWSQVEVPFGCLTVVPLKLSQKARLTVEPTRKFRIGSAEKGESVKTSPGEEIRGGLVGLIIDARGRPVVLPADGEKRQKKISEWAAAIGAYKSHRRTF